MWACDIYIGNQSNINSHSKNFELIKFSPCLQAVREEIFGSVAAVLQFKTEEEAIRRYF